MCSGKVPKPKKVCILGSGNWATAVARIVGWNAQRLDGLHDIVVMYVYEEMVDGKKLSEIINEEHENVKYLPGYPIPENVVAVPDIVVAAKDADALIFVIPHQNVRNICANLFGKIKPTASALSMIKGFGEADDGGIELISGLIQKLLRINVSVLMGALVPGEIACGMFAEGTLGCQNKQIGPLWSEILSSENFKITTTDDMTSVEVYSGLKSIVAIGAGIVDGLDCGHNTKATLMRMCMMEIIKFVDVFFPGGKLSTFFESCGVADLITTCYSSRNRRIGEVFVRTGKSMLFLEEELLEGQELQGPNSAERVNSMLKTRDIEYRFPLLTAIHRICKGTMKPGDLVEAMKVHPEAVLVIKNTSF